MDTMTIIWAVICFAVAVILFFLEIFVPSGGIIGFVAAASLVSGIVLLFRIDTTLGLVGILVSLVCFPFLAGFAFNLWPHTPIGRRLMLHQRQPTLSSAHNAEPAAEQAPSLVGQAGKAVTDLRPIGTVLIDGRRVECLAAAGVIRSGTPVKVISVDGMQIKVREA